MSPLSNYGLRAQQKPIREQAEGLFSPPCAHTAPVCKGKQGHGEGMPATAPHQSDGLVGGIHATCLVSRIGRPDSSDREQPAFLNSATLGIHILPSTCEFIAQELSVFQTPKVILVTTQSSKCSVRLAKVTEAKRYN